MVSNVRASIGVGLLVGLALSLLMWVISASPAQAETLTDCQAEIDQAKALLTDTNNPNYIDIDSFTNQKDREGLVGKLDSASTKLSEGKTEDALAILIGLRDIKVPTLVDQGKLAQEDADVLLVEINEAIGCIEGPQAQAPTAA